ncbi:hypothetical protein GCK72_007526 [Caenorhabditis remanei]|uniref:Uncharacterized protein n=1 Tax=Caenorhabditis remanei TaxID=31234 RepID=A0A6A5HMB2_CAERE|nr:hypothetical protein GCK72_007526 [Caenorhabditis remanei]KAF1767567.1 hypothetical protein GCK72_007526 [Caenorhabditis remanei]
MKWKRSADDCEGSDIADLLDEKADRSNIPITEKVGCVRNITCNADINTYVAIFLNASEIVLPDHVPLNLAFDSLSLFAMISLTLSMIKNDLKCPSGSGSETFVSWDGLGSSESESDSMDSELLEEMGGADGSNAICDCPQPIVTDND